jgi:hypothetical protein
LSALELPSAMAKEAASATAAGPFSTICTEERAAALRPDEVRGEISTRYFGPVDVCP